MQVAWNKESTKQITMHSVGLYLDMYDFLFQFKKISQYMWCVFLLKRSQCIRKRMEYVFLQNN